MRSQSQTWPSDWTSWLSGKEICLPGQEMGVDPWVGKIPWRREWQPPPVFSPGNPMDRGAWQATVYDPKESDVTQWLSTGVCTWLTSLDFTRLWKQHALSRNRTSDVQFRSFLRLVYVGLTVFRDAGQGREWPLGLRTDTKLFCTQSFCLSFSVQYSINYVSYSTLHYPTGFVFDDPAQLWANSVQSMLKLGKVKLRLWGA